MISSTKKVTLNDIIGNHPLMQKQRAIARKAASCDAPVLLYGETGTGKELFARAIHNLSSRKDGVFIGQNCSAIPANLFEGIFFGTEKGAYTGAVSSPGIFQQADGGTLLLDELNSMPLHLQSKLLRAIQEGCVRRVGGLSEQSVDTRIITTVNEDPELLVQQGYIRADLFYRLNVVRINIPPLRDHREDIPDYVNCFIRKSNLKHSRNVRGVSDSVMKTLMERDYPGNIRQLEHLIESSVVLCDDEIISELI